MANALYRPARSAFARGVIDWEADTFRLYAADATLTWDPAHEFLADTAIGTAGLDFTVLTGCTVGDDGVCDAADATFSGVGAGMTVARLLIAQWSGDAATSRVIAWLDTGWDGLPLARTSDGSPIPVAWSDSAQRVFRL